ncbi:hypothetical protein CTI14_68255, partial [Methylobacterium radiotolerans]
TRPWRATWPTTHVVLSDYAKGVLTRVESLIALARSAGIRCWWIPRAMTRPWRATWPTTHVVLSDYAKGVLTRVESLIALA